MSNLSKKFFNNARKPQGLLGKWIMRFMNGHAHQDLADWAFPFFDIDDGDSILDIGCGGGGNVARFLKKFPNSIVKGIDYSPVSVALSREINQDEITKGRCQITEGNVLNLPYESFSMDVVSAFETVYYWPDLVDSFRQVYRVLKPNGKFIVINGADAEGGWIWDKYIDGMHTYTPSELRQYLESSGFKEVKVVRKKDLHFLCVIAYKHI